MMTPHPNFRHLNLNVLTPRDNSEVHKCQWCGGTFTSDNKRHELISDVPEGIAISVGIMCSYCYDLLLRLPQDYWVANARWHKKLLLAAYDTATWNEIYDNPPKGLR